MIICFLFMHEDILWNLKFMMEIFVFFDVMMERNVWTILY